jgi:hypothetical protein
MNAGRDFLLFVLFLIGLGIVWFFTGGPTRALSHSGWFLSPPSPLGNGEGYNLPGVPLASSTSDWSKSNTYTNAYSDRYPSGNNSVWDYFFNYRPGTGQVNRPPDSSYAQYVSFYGGNTQTDDPKSEYVVIQTDSNLRGTITMTGWSLESAQTGLRVSIGNAAQIPFLGQMNSEVPISVGPMSRVVVITGHSPNGTSFRLNKCTGYFNQFQKFVPSIREECPRPQDEMLLHPQQLSGNQSCQDFVATLPQCRLTLSAIPGNVGGLCQDFILNTLSYNGCISAHQSDPDFYRNEWRLYLNRDQELWANNHEGIRLLDESGKLVGEITY